MNIIIKTVQKIVKVKIIRYGPLGFMFIPKDTYNNFVQPGYRTTKNSIKYYFRDFTRDETKKSNFTS